MVVRARRLFGPTTPSAGATSSVYTVPAGRTALFTGVWVVLAGAGTGAVLFRVNSSTAGSVAFVTATGALVQAVVLVNYRLNPGDELFVTVPASVTCIVTGAGSLLDGAPA